MKNADDGVYMSQTVAGVEVMCEDINSWEVPRVYTVEDIRQRTKGIWDQIPNISKVWIAARSLDENVRRTDLLEFTGDLDLSYPGSETSDILSIGACLIGVLGKDCIFDTLGKEPYKNKILIYSRKEN